MYYEWLCWLFWLLLCRVGRCTWESICAYVQNAFLVVFCILFFFFFFYRFSVHAYAAWFCIAVGCCCSSWTLAADILLAATGASLGSRIGALNHSQMFRICPFIWLDVKHWPSSSWSCPCRSIHRCDADARVNGASQILGYSRAGLLSMRAERNVNWIGWFLKMIGFHVYSSLAPDLIGRATRSEGQLAWPTETILTRSLKLCWMLK